MDLPVAQFVDAVHQKNSPRLWRHRIDGRFIKPEKVGGLDIPFLLRRTRRVAVFEEGEEDDRLAAPPPRAIDEQILGDAPQKAARIDQPMPLSASRGAREHFLDKIGRLFGPGLAAQVAKQGTAMRPKRLVEIGVRGALDDLQIAPVVGRYGIDR